ncbi:MAG: 30S ribosomal protein S16 [Deltaproteobacteria bacterium]|jgi:small subunit ribosomal protein S16|nr:30S ribosomal protein S16 [Deltaproteobacteria bacterium]MBW2517320.1 30S ribosomal protein S16 [Deltaproteobacteria bacterium]
MGVRIRLARHGAKKKPFYRIVVADGESPRDGRFLEKVGTYDPLKEPAEVKLNSDRIKYWIDKGAIPSHTVKSIFKKEGIFAKNA